MPVWDVQPVTPAFSYVNFIYGRFVVHLMGILQTFCSARFVLFLRAFCRDFVFLLFILICFCAFFYRDNSNILQRFHVVLRVYVKDITYTFDKNHVHLICVRFKRHFVFFCQMFIRILLTFYVLRVFFPSLFYRDSVEGLQ